jgi:outer membrane protein assembly factor BamB
MRLPLLPLVALLLAGRLAADETGLLAHWSFNSDRSQNAGLKPVAGGIELTILGPTRFEKDPGPPRLELPGREEKLVAGRLDKALLPRTNLTAEAWVRVDRVSQWGGIIGRLQDNGEFERGFLLGFVNDRFSFAVASEGHPRLTYLAAAQPFATNQWYHVAGTYDGAELRIYVNGALSASSREQSGPLFHPDTAPLTVGSYQDDDERYPLTGALSEVRLYRRTLTPDEIRAHFTARKAEFPQPAPPPVVFRPDYGPFVDWQNRTSAFVTWETDTAQPTRLELEAPDGKRTTLGDGKATREHRVELSGLERDREYHYRLVGPPQDGRTVVSSRYQFDTSFYYRPALAPANAPAPTPQVGSLVQRILGQTGVRAGYCLVLGSEDGRLAAELARSSELKVVVLESDPKRIAAIRRTFTEAGLQGVRAAVHEIDATAKSLPYGDLFANLIVAESSFTTGRPPTLPAAEVHRLLRPVGGTFFAGGEKTDAPAWQAWLAGSPLSQVALAASPSTDGTWVQFRRGKLAGAGEWGHQYGGPDNSSCSQDELVGGEMQTAWWGDPGPRPMPDRGNRNPAPLSVNGRLFVQGNRILFGLDAYNGAILWNVSTPEIRRANVTRDCSNMAASGDTLFVAHGRYCLAFDGQTGQRRTRFAVPTTGADGPRDWGYVAAGERLLLGSREKRDGLYRGDDGEWYEEYAPDQVSRITSDLLFALDPTTGKPLWEYRRGAILNSTITLGDGMIFFLESRNPEAIQSPSCRIANEALTEQFLVCLDQRTGKQLWDKGHDFSALQFMTYLVHGQGRVVVTGTDRNKHYHTFAFNAPDPAKPASGGDDLEAAIGGRLVWSESHKEDKGHHSGHLQHPVVIGGVFYSDQRSFDLATGKTLRTDLPERRGCGIMSAGKNAIFFRHHFQSMWDLTTNKRTQFEGIRSGCWLGLVPAGGFLLAPETSAGCSCTHAIQTSVGYIPKSLVQARP